MKASLILLTLLLTIPACFQEKTEITINSDLSSRIVSEVRMPNIVIEALSKEPETSFSSFKTIVENGFLIPIKLSAQDLSESLPENAELKDHMIRKDKNDTFISFALLSKDEETLGKIVGERFKLYSGDEFTRLVCEVVDIPLSREIRFKEKSINPNEAYEGYMTTITIHAPQAITRHNCGTLSTDRKTLTYTFPVIEGPDIDRGIMLIEWKTPVSK